MTKCYNFQSFPMWTLWSVQSHCTKSYPTLTLTNSFHFILGSQVLIEIRFVMARVIYVDLSSRIFVLFFSFYISWGAQKAGEETTNLSRLDQVGPLIVAEWAGGGLELLPLQRHQLSLLFLYIISLHSFANFNLSYCEFCRRNMKTEAHHLETIRALAWWLAWLASSATA